MLLFFIENISESLSLFAFGLGLTSAAMLLRSMIAPAKAKEGEENPGKEG